MSIFKAVKAYCSIFKTYFDFDEIDTGVSGEIRLGWGEIMKEMSQDMQIFAITHFTSNAKERLLKKTNGW
jgi:DNA repair protein RecN (Recombination protein N)